MQSDVIVVGAGVVDLAAAFELIRDGRVARLVAAKIGTEA
jgi:glycine/D-amino acid oxidase-like deaminating enzyme